jgi:hypothetical protein
MQNSETPGEEQKPRLRDLITWPSRFNEPKYPWDDWFDGSIWRLHQYQDFDVHVESMRSAVYMAADRMGYRVKTHIPRKKDQIYVQRIGKKMNKLERAEHRAQKKAKYSAHEALRVEEQQIVDSRESTSE